MVLLFDDAKKLEKAVGEEAAEVIAHVLEKHEEKSKQELEEAKKELVTRADLYKVEGNLKADMTRLETKVENIESNLENKIRAEVQAAKSETIKWMAGMLMVQAATVAALVKLLG
ncbi:MULTISPECIES: hypothetical protein [unclassified Desulfovibrio]|uniref:hypothetical protein n=1 Tax=unclassified Desulfovibrio TaxID=2593640 RepID=UPI0013D2FA09|nr:MULTISPECIES: hypothetical protein [unclassified Desulfovibrio]NDV23829.1 hypothetical protein [Desulfovibrio sp. JC022]NDV28158.1 hypothetical protein [Desulfovibrio sp. JC010]